MSKTVIFTFLESAPPTISDKKIIKSLIEEAKRLEYEPRIFVSENEEPITFSTRKRIIETFSEGVQVEKCDGLTGAFKKLSEEGHNELVLATTTGVANIVEDYGSLIMESFDLEYFITAGIDSPKVALTEDFNEFMNSLAIKNVAEARSMYKTMKRQASRKTLEEDSRIFPHIRTALSGFSQQKSHDKAIFAYERAVDGDNKKGKKKTMQKIAYDIARTYDIDYRKFLANIRKAVQSGALEAQYMPEDLNEFAGVDRKSDKYSKLTEMLNDMDKEQLEIIVEDNIPTVSKLAQNRLSFR